MRFATISNTFFDLCSFDSELLTNKEKRPHVIILKLKYKSKLYDFAIPFRSNISRSVPRHLYFSLPPRPATRPNNRHGLHYIKMFPIKKKYLQKFHFDNSSYYLLIENIIKRDTKKIINEAQKYLNNYSNGIIPRFSTDIDKILDILNN